MEEIKDVISSILLAAIKEEGVELKKEEIEKFIEIPPNHEMGDYAFPCFFLAGRLKSPPDEIALNVRGHIADIPEGFEDIQTSGPYINFFVDRKVLALDLIQEIKSSGENYGKTSATGKTVLVEFSSPNIAKPFGIGHLRSTIIGNAIANLADFNGYKVIRFNYLGDWGTQFGKLIVGYKKYGDNKKLKEDPIRHLLEVYVKINKEKHEDEARAWFKKLEDGNKEALRLWNKFKKLSLKDFEKIYNLLGIKFDVYSGESMDNKKMPKVIEELKLKKLLVSSEGALIIDLEKYKLGVCIIQKSDGSTIYAARDIASAIDRYNKYKFDRMVYEVGQEQKLHFQQVFKVLELMGYPWAKNCVHADHGLYLGEDGKKFATRKGKTIFMEDIIDETKKLAAKEIKKRFTGISEKELEKRALKVAIAAIFYGDLKNNRTNDAVFDIKRFVSFEGDTGPYMLYSYARASSILKKIKKELKPTDLEELEKAEVELVKKLNEFKNVSLKAYQLLNPNLIANYSYQLSQIFNEFYHSCPVIGSEKEAFRVDLVTCFRQIMKISLNLLGIEPLEKM